MPSTTLTIDQIDISPLNVRTHRPDIDDTAVLEASILAEGLLNAIDVHPMRASKKWGAIAGGRRTRAIKALVARGDLPKDWPVAVNRHEGLSDAALIELSITENLIRRDLRDHELWAGVARARAKGHDAEQIARGLGQDDLAKVQRWIRLGQLAPPIFAALAAGRIDEQQARAYAATEDQALQVATFTRLSTGPHHAHTAAHIRAAMKIGDVEQRRQLAFVGPEAYRAAGGWFEVDLFAEPGEDRGRIADVGLLQGLVDTKLGEAKAEVRERAGRPDLRFVVKPPQTTYDTDDHHLQVQPKTEDGRFLLPAGDIVGHVAIDRDGQPAVSFWWASRTAKAAGAPKPVPVSTGPTRAGPTPPGIAAPEDRRDADAAIREDTGLSRDAIEILRSLRRVLLRSVLANDAALHGTVGRDYLVWAQLRQIIGAEVAQRIGLRKPGAEDIGGFDLAQKARAIIAETGASKPYGDSIQELSRQSFLTEPDLVVAFEDYRASNERLKNLAAAVVAGFALERSLATDGYALPIHDAVAAATGVAADHELRDFWTPTASLIALTPKAQRTDLAANVTDAATRDQWRGLKGDDITDRVRTAVAATADWVHPLLSFDPAPEPAAVDQLEAAE